MNAYKEILDDIQDVSNEVKKTQAKMDNFDFQYLGQYDKEIKEKSSCLHDRVRRINAFIRDM
jgi:peptidoglycan hydrolase CwlO-like protein